MEYYNCLKINKAMIIIALKVTRAGFKPTTACLEGRSSIQLSYRVEMVKATPEGVVQQPAKI